MKKIFGIILYFFVAIPLLCQVIPKKANTIIVRDTLTMDQFYDCISTVLFEGGYGILNGDKDLGQITTTEKSFKDGIVKLNIFIKDKRVLIRGDFKASMSIEVGGVTSTESWSAIDYRGMKGSIYQNAWIEMSKVAGQISGIKEYLVK